MQRDTQKLVDAKKKLLALSVGGSAERPERVQSASVVEVLAAAAPCFVCAGSVRVLDHRAERGLRVVSVRCKDCGTQREAYFVLDERLAN